MTEELNLDELTALTKKYRLEGTDYWQQTESRLYKVHFLTLAGFEITVDDLYEDDARTLAALLEALPRLIALCKDQAETIKEWRHNQWDAADYD